MKKSFVSLLAFTAVTFGMVSCGGTQKKEAKQDVEKEAVIAGEVSKDLLAVELKLEVKSFCKDFPASTLPQKLKTGEVKISVSNTDFMLPISKLAELNTKTQKARALGMYFADANVLKAMGKPMTEIDAVLTKLVTDLDMPFAIDIMKEANATANDKVEMEKYVAARDKFIDAMIDNDKTDVLLEIAGGMSVEYGLIYANPSLVIKGEAVTEGLSKNMEKRLDMLMEITNDLAKYYPDVQFMGKTIEPLKDMMIPLELARESKSEIEAMRDTLLK